MPPNPKDPASSLSRDSRVEQDHSVICRQTSGPERGYSVSSRFLAQHSSRNSDYGLSNIEVRLESFNKWPTGLRQKSWHMAEAGFYYVGLADKVKCFHCGGGLAEWQPEDDPWVEHAKWLPNCTWLLGMKGSIFVEEAKKVIHQRQSQQLEKVEPVKQQVKTPLTKQKRISPDQEVAQHSTFKSQNTKDNNSLLTEEKSKLRDQKTCRVCQIKEVSVVILPCGHLSSCGDCAPTLKDCPVCKSPVAGTVRAFLS